MEYKTDAEKKTFYNSTAWKKLRVQALERDNYECQECKRRGYVTVDSIKQDGKPKEIALNVHHKFEIEDYPKLALFLDNLETLCLYHHNVTHDRVFKRKESKWNDERW